MRNVSIKAFKSLVGVTAVLSAFASSGASGQVVEEIIVTSKQRTESLQEIPLSVAAFTNEGLQQAQIFDVRDLSNLVPSLNMAAGGGRADPTALSIRGLAPNTSDERYQGVSTFIDGIALSGQLLGLDLSQVERVEVIRGPQSATFGRSTYSGAINFITKTPTEDVPTGNFRARISSNKGAPQANYYVNAAVNAPLIKDRLWGGIQVMTRRQGALYNDVFDNSPISQEKTDSIAATMYLQATDDLSVKLRFSRDLDDDTANHQWNIHPREFLALGVPTVTLDRAGGALWPTEVPDAQLGIRAGLDKGIGEPLDGGRERERMFASALITYDLDGYELSNRFGMFFSEARRVGSFSDTRSTVAGQDPTFGSLIGGPEITFPAFSFIISSREEFTNYSNQVLLLSPGTERLRWKIGANYFYENSTNYLINFANANNPFGRWREEELENYAGFGGVDYDISEELTLSVEGRLAHESVRWLECSFCVNTNPADVERKSTDFTPRVTVDYALNEDQHFYGLYSRGVKSGRLSRLTVGGAPLFLYADPEILDNYEVGSKNTFLDGSLSLNVSIYRSNVKNQQLVTSQNVTVGGGAVPLTYANNVGSSRINGFEIESNFRPSDSWAFAGGIGYADQKFTNKDPVILQFGSEVTFPGVAGDPVVLDGKTQSNVPKVTGFVSATYDVATPVAGFNLRAYMDASYRSSIYADLANIAKVPSTWKANARISAERDGVEFALFARNLFNDATTSVTGLAGGTGGCQFTETDTATYGTSQRCLTVTRPRPREVGVEVSYRF